MKIWIPFDLKTCPSLRARRRRMAVEVTSRGAQTQHLRQCKWIKLTIRCCNLCCTPGSSSLFPNSQTNSLLVWARYFVGLIFNWRWFCVCSRENPTIFFFPVLFQDWEYRILIIFNIIIINRDKLYLGDSIFSTEINVHSRTIAGRSWVIQSCWVPVEHSGGFVKVIRWILVWVVIVSQDCLDRDTVTWRVSFCHFTWSQWIKVELCLSGPSSG